MGKFTRKYKGGLKMATFNIRNYASICSVDIAHTVENVPAYVCDDKGGLVCVVCSGELVTRAVVCPSGANHGGINMGSGSLCVVCGYDMDTVIFEELQEDRDVFLIAGPQGRPCVAALDNEELAIMEIKDYSLVDEDLKP
jgi:hypothetical protein